MGWVMREADFEVLLRLVERLGGAQRAALGRALASASGEPEATRLLEDAFATAPRCPHCAAAAPQRWSHASGLRRILCHRERRHVGQQLTLSYERKRIMLEQTDATIGLAGQYVAAPSGENEQAVRSKPNRLYGANRTSRTVA